MKKLFLVMVALVLATSFVFAGGSKESSESDLPTVRLITDATGIDDKSFNAAAWRGILEFYGDTWENQAGRGKNYDVVTCQTSDLYVPTLKQAADNGYDLIIATGFTFADAIGEVAELYPEENFMIVDVSWVGKPNLQEYIYAEEQGSFLVGALVALKAKEDGIANPKFGFIGGVPGSTITKFEVGYIQGLRHVMPELADKDIFDYYTNDWGAPEKAKTQAKNWYDQGVYAIFSAAGGSGNGTIAQAKEYRVQGKDVWAIGVDSDQHAEGIYDGDKSAVLTSMIKKVETSTKLALTAIQNDTFKGGVIELDMETDGVGYANTNKEAISASVAAEIEIIKKDIVSGDIKVTKTYKESLAAGLVPAGLGAKDD